MQLSQAQEEFSLCLAKFVLWIYEQGWRVRWGEVWRTEEQAAIYATKDPSLLAQIERLLGLSKQLRPGAGIKSSVHRKKLAADLYLVIEGDSVTWNGDDYKPLGDKWKSMHSLARWGGDFARRDAFHFSFEWNGVK
jgi:hypothetical protein